MIPLPFRVYFARSSSYLVDSDAMQLVGYRHMDSHGEGLVV